MKKMRKNPRKPKTQIVVEEKVTSDSETSENSNSDDPKIPENKATEYEKKRELRIAQNKARIEDLGLRNIANSLMNISQKGGKRKSNLNSKRVPKNGKDDDEYQPIDEDPKDDSSDSSLDSSSEEFEEQGKRKKKQKKKVSDRKSRSRKQRSLQKQLDTTGLMDEDEALKQAIALSLKDVGETSDMQHAGSSQNPNKQAVNANEKSYDHSREDNSRRKKRSFKNRVQMTEDDLVINFCQFDETGKGSITFRDLQRMAASHDFIWTDKELADMIRCFDGDKDGKLTLDDFRNIILQCNMLHAPENP